MVYRAVDSLRDLRQRVQEIGRILKASPGVFLEEHLDENK